MSPRDHLTNPRVRAFLRMTRFCEGTADDDGYRRLFGGREFESFADHPRIRFYERRDGQFLKNGKIDYTTAAGAYQIVESTWNKLVKLYALPDFSPESQDMAAIALIHGRGALQDVLAGRIEAAIAKCNKEWASFHGSPYGQRTVSLDRMLQEYRKWLVEAAPIVESEPSWVAPEGGRLMGKLREWLWRMLPTH